jgi:hypothetical protein
MRVLVTGASGTLAPFVIRALYLLYLLLKILSCILYQ